MATQQRFARQPSQPATIIKQTTTRLPQNFYFHVVAGIIVMTVAGLTVRGLVYRAEIEECSNRYGVGTMFGLQDKSGNSVSPPELQARLAGRDWGLLENAKIVSIKDGPAPVALQVELPKVVAASDGRPEPKSGMGFTWLPSKLKEAKAACLTYSIWLPDNFKFGPGGSLPGLFGGLSSDTPTSNPEGGFSTRNSWTEEGQMQVRAITADEPTGANYVIDPNKLQLETGRWTQIEQEVILNDPGESNGTLRIWVDGKLRLETSDMVYRTSEKALLRGVIADVHYGNSALTVAPAPRSTTVRITPFELRWQ